MKKPKLELNKLRRKKRIRRNNRQMQKQAFSRPQQPKRNYPQAKKKLPSRKSMIKEGQNLALSTPL